MTTTPAAYILGDLHGDPGLVLDTLRAHAVAQAASGSPDGMVWWIDDTGPDHDRCLIVGVRGTCGVLVWDDHDSGTYIPADGTNTTTVDYYTATGEHYPQQPGRELALDRVLAAVAEFVSTGRQPTSVEWVADTRPRA
ncbi:Imm1 family immunity protein [Actinokineospora inagensis]|uniref:Imm1 family immunity protein n=1 Tax=Actinokineospora inagensis TaxID=103730 RepID=UPI000423AF71|nr:Imm1 family immunity protein [Actinokineospora inagensis]